MPLLQDKAFSKGIQPVSEQFLFSVYLSHMHNEVYYLVGITPFIVIPCNQLYEVGVQGNTCSCIENAGSGIGDKVGGYNCISVYPMTLHPFSGSLLYSFLDFIIGCSLFQTAGQVNYRNVDGRNTKAIPVNLPFSSGITLPTAFAAPVEDGMMFAAAARPPLQSFLEGPSTVFWVAVVA